MAKGQIRMGGEHRSALIQMLYAETILEQGRVNPLSASSSLRIAAVAALAGSASGLFAGLWLPAVESAPLIMVLGRWAEWFHFGVELVFAGVLLLGVAAMLWRGCHGLTAALGATAAFGVGCAPWMLIGVLWSMPDMVALRVALGNLGAAWPHVLIHTSGQVAVALLMFGVAIACRSRWQREAPETASCPGWVYRHAYMAIALVSALGATLGVAGYRSLVLPQVRFLTAFDAPARPIHCEIQYRAAPGVSSSDEVGIVGWWIPEEAGSKSGYVVQRIKRTNQPGCEMYVTRASRESASSGGFGGDAHAGTVVVTARLGPEDAARVLKVRGLPEKLRNAIRAEADRVNWSPRHLGFYLGPGGEMQRYPENQIIVDVPELVQGG